MKKTGGDKDLVASLYASAEDVAAVCAGMRDPMGGLLAFVISNDAHS